MEPSNSQMERQELLLPRIIARLREITSPRRFSGGWQASKDDELFSGSPYAYVAYETAQRLEHAQFQFPDRLEFRRQFRALHAQPKSLRRRVIRRWGDAVEREPDLAEKIGRWLKLDPKTARSASRKTPSLSSLEEQESLSLSLARLETRPRQEPSDGPRTETRRDAARGPLDGTEESAAETFTSSKETTNRGAKSDTSIQETVVARGATPPPIIAADRPSITASAVAKRAAGPPIATERDAESATGADPPVILVEDPALSKNTANDTPVTAQTHLTSVEMQPNSTFASSLPIQEHLPGSTRGKEPDTSPFDSHHFPFGNPYDQHFIDTIGIEIGSRGVSSFSASDDVVAGPSSRPAQGKERDEALPPGKTLTSSNRLIEEPVFSENSQGSTSIERNVVERGGTVRPPPIVAQVQSRPGSTPDGRFQVMDVTPRQPASRNVEYVPLVASPLYIEKENASGTQVIRGVSEEGARQVFPEALNKAICRAPLCKDNQRIFPDVEVAFFGPGRLVERCRIYLRIRKQDVVKVAKVLFDVDIEERGEYRYIRLPHTKTRVVCVPGMLLIDPPRAKLATMFGREVAEAILKGPIVQLENQRPQWTEVTEAVGFTVPPYVGDPGEFVLSVAYDEGCEIGAKFFDWARSHGTEALKTTYYVPGEPVPERSMGGV